MAKDKSGITRNRVGRVLRERGESVYEISIKSGVGANTLHRYVRDPEYLGNLTPLIAVARVLNVKLWDLLEGDVVSDCDCSQKY